MAIIKKYQVLIDGIYKLKYSSKFCDCLNFKSITDLLDLLVTVMFDNFIFPLFKKSDKTEPYIGLNS